MQFADTAHILFAFNVCTSNIFQDTFDGPIDDDFRKDLIVGARGI